MTYKDPKDMTISELLRKAAMRETDEWGNITPHVKLYSALSGEDAAATDYVERGDLLRKLADKIDGEIVKAYSEKLDTCAMRWAKANGWPDFKQGEDFGAWLDRCAIPRPRFEDGEPVQSSDIEEIGALATCRVYMDGSWEFDPDKYEDERNPKPWDVQSGAKSDRIKRPAPEVLGADGLPLNEDDTVYGTGREQHRYTVQVPYSINEVIGQRFCVQCYDHDEGNITWCDPSMLTHTPPDTLERLRDDMYRTAEEWREADSVSVTDMNHWANRLTALIERMGGAE